MFLGDFSVAAVFVGDFVVEGGLEPCGEVRLLPELALEEFEFCRQVTKLKYFSSIFLRAAGINKEN